jgi:4-hydroxythreonine-4-phosphate dehydrogenase
VGITLGDPAGIGPEIVVKALTRPDLFELCHPVIVGDLNLLQSVVNQLDVDLKLQTISSPSKPAPENHVVEIIDLQNVDLPQLGIGKVSAMAGKAALEYIEVAVNYALEGRLDAVATAPINKESIRLAGSPHIGHTEFIGALTNTPEPLTMFWVRGVRIFFLTRHLSLRKAVQAVTCERIKDTVIRVHRLLRRIGVVEPHIAIAALNPHAGDGGMMGREEIQKVLPAINRLREQRINAVGPIPADAVFHQAFAGAYDAVLALYHDQGHIAAKTVDFHGTVSVTLGLPFIRTSVDHGTAFDIAGTGVANSSSLEEAIRVAAEITMRIRQRSPSQ